MRQNIARKPGENAKAEKTKAYTTTTERKSFGEFFWPQRKTFQAGGRYENPIKPGKPYLPPKSSSATPIFSAKKSSPLEQGGVCFLFMKGRPTPKKPPTQIKAQFGFYLGGWLFGWVAFRWSFSQQRDKWFHFHAASCSGLGLKSRTP